MMYERQQTRFDGSKTIYERQKPVKLDRRKNNITTNNHGNKKEVSRRNVNEEEERLDIIDLSGLSLDALPTPASINLPAICKLDLSNNNIESIPESLTARLLNVMVLDVHSNQLTSLPNSIGCLSKLKILNVSGNLLTSLPRTIENCRSLEELHANFNKLTMLPDTMGFELQNLKKLCINSNKMVILPYSICHATSLRLLDVRLNCLRSLPNDLENLVNLEVLNASQNFQYLVELPDSIGLLMSLLELDVSYNKISCLPTSIGCLPRLHKLRVEGNPLVSPPMDVVDQGLQAVRVYLSEKINGHHQEFPKKKSWFRQLKKYGAHRGRVGPRGGLQSGLDSPLPECRPVHNVLASPRYKFGIFSPRRFFSSPDHYFSRLG